MTLKRDLLCEKTRGHLEAPLPVTSDLSLLRLPQLRTRWLLDLLGLPMAARRAGRGREGAGRRNLQKLTEGRSSFSGSFKAVMERGQAERGQAERGL